MSSIENRLLELGIALPKPLKPKFIYVSAKRVGNLLYTSGQDCRIDGKLKYEGKVGKELTIEQGQDAARITAINCLAVIKDQIGDLDKVKQVVKLLGFVNSADGFADQPDVMNGASQLIEEVFGDKGKHARSAVASNELPFNTPVEIEMIVEIE